MESFHLAFIPLIMGPAALTTIILVVNAYGYALAVAKVVALFLTGIAVMMIRTGIQAMICGR